MKLWRCPNGRHPAVRAPARPRRNASVRYCLACSAASTTLVERVCESLERERTQRKASRTKRRTKERLTAEQQLAQRFTVDGVDLRRVWDAMRRLPLVPEACRNAAFHVRRTSVHPRSRIGLAWYLENRTQITVWPGRALVGCIRTMIHELAHLVSWQRYGREGAGHGGRFRGTLADLTAEWIERYPALAPGSDRRPAPLDDAADDALAQTKAASTNDT